VKKHATFKWKYAISGFPVSPFSAEALVGWGGKIKYILIAYFLGNICAKNCCNRTVYVKIIACCKGGTFFETRCTCLCACACIEAASNTLQLNGIILWMRLFHIGRLCFLVMVTICKKLVLKNYPINFVETCTAYQTWMVRYLFLIG